ncbi:MAG: ribosome silencing factor [Myxococcota bacterium]
MTRTRLPQSELAGIALAQTCATLLEDKKAEDIRILNIAALNSYTDHLVICSGTGRRHVLAAAHHVTRELKRRGKRPLGVEGERGQEAGIEEGSWVLLDYGDTIVHVFTPQARAHYDIEGLWADAPRVKSAKTARIPK